MSDQKPPVLDDLEYYCWEADYKAGLAPKPPSTYISKRETELPFYQTDDGLSVRERFAIFIFVELLRTADHTTDQDMLMEKSYEIADKTLQEIRNVSISS